MRAPLIPVVLLLLSACATAPSPVLVARDPYDDQLAAVASRAPGFGGMRMDEEGRLNVLMKGAADKAKVGQALADVMGRLFFEQLAPFKSRPEKKNLPELWADMKLAVADYDFRELLDWREKARAARVFAVVDHGGNRLIVSLSSQDKREEVEKRMAAAGIPAKAVVYKAYETVQPGKGLADTDRPARGGFRIQRDYWWGPSGFVCSLGFNATLNGIPGFMTCAHCTHNIGRSNNDLFHQPEDHLTDDSHQFAREEVDPAPFSCTTTGGAARLCRDSDSAFMEYKFGATGAPGLIARPRHSNTAKFVKVGNGQVLVADRELDGARPSFKIVDIAGTTMLGMTLHKVGSKTGWSFGRATNDLINGGGGGAVITLNERKVERISGTHLMTSKGDSGAPVFELLDDEGHVRLHGLLTGQASTNDFSRFTMTGIQALRSDFPGLVIPTVAPPPPVPPVQPRPGPPPSRQQCRDDCALGYAACLAEGIRPQDCRFERDHLCLPLCPED